MAHTYADDWGIHDNNYSWLIRGPGGSSRQVLLGGGSVMACQDWDLFVVWRSGIEFNWSSGYFYVNKGGGFGMASDERIKKDIEPIDYKQSTDFIRAIKPATFCLKQGHTQKVRLADGTETETECGGYCNCRESGFIAQNVLEACNRSGVPKSAINHWYDYEQQLGKPEEERTAILGVCDRPILSHTVNAVKALMEQVETLQQRNTILEAAARQAEAKQKEQEERLRKAEAGLEKMASLLSQLISSK